LTEPPSGLQAVFAKAPFITELGMRIVDAGEGWLVTELDVEERFRQQHGFAHAGVVATVADHTAGGAASTIVAEGRSVLTSEYTIHLLRPAEGDRLRCRSEVVKPGSRLIVVQADVWAGEEHCARYLGTMAVVERAL
jgi:uncharacterized protein (TIGR00369 family)